MCSIMFFHIQACLGVVSVIMSLLWCSLRARRCTKTKVHRGHKVILSKHAQSHLNVISQHTEWDMWWKRKSGINKWSADNALRCTVCVEAIVQRQWHCLLCHQRLNSWFIAEYNESFQTWHYNDNMSEHVHKFTSQFTSYDNIRKQIVVNSCVFGIYQIKNTTL